MSDLQYLPVSKVNTVVFCPRRFHLEYVLGEAEVNHHVLEGRGLHEGAYTEVGERSNVWTWSDRLGLVGILDRVEPGPDGAPVPVEYKVGRRGDFESDAAQLCAQALCLEERLGREVARGFVYYHATRRRREVAFSPALRALTEAAVLEMRALAASPRPPGVAVPKTKCAGCSVRPACQPELWRRRAPGAGGRA